MTRLSSVVFFFLFTTVFFAPSCSRAELHITERKKWWSSTTASISSGHAKLVSGLETALMENAAHFFDDVNLRPPHPFNLSHPSLRDNALFVQHVSKFVSEREDDARYGEGKERILPTRNGLSECVIRQVLRTEYRQKRDQTDNNHNPDHLFSSPPLSLANTPLPLGVPFLLAADIQRQSDSGSESDRDEYRDACRAAAMTHAALAVFRAVPEYVLVVGHVLEPFASGYLELVEEICLSLLVCLPQWRAADSVGAVYNMRYYGDLGWLSGDLLRYAFVTADVMRHFGDLSGFHIMEIGSGWGGQMKTISDVFPLGSYSMVDIPEALALTSRWLELFPDAASLAVFVPSVGGYQQRNEDNKNQESSSDDDDNNDNKEEEWSVMDDRLLLPWYDLCISNFAFDELSRPLQEIYWHRILTRCRRGYITDNEMGRGMGDSEQGQQRQQQLHWKEQMERLKADGRDVWIEPQLPGEQRGHVLLWRTL